MIAETCSEISAPREKSRTLKAVKIRYRFPSRSAVGNCAAESDVWLAQKTIMKNNLPVFVFSLLGLCAAHQRTYAIDPAPLDYVIKLEAVMKHDDGMFLWFQPRAAAIPNALASKLWKLRTPAGSD